MPGLISAFRCPHCRAQKAKYCYYTGRIKCSGQYIKDPDSDYLENGPGGFSALHQTSMKLVLFEFAWRTIIFCLKYRCEIIRIGKTDHIGNFRNGIVFVDEEVFGFF